jgi:hypothetical protein
MKISSLFVSYIIYNQINFQGVFAQSSNEPYKPFNDFYSIVLTALIPLAVTTLEKKKGNPKFNLLDDLIIVFSILLCPLLNVGEILMGYLEK